MKTGIACQGYCHSFSFAPLWPGRYKADPGDPGHSNYVSTQLHQYFYYTKTANNTNKIHSRKTGTFCNNFELECRLGLFITSAPLLKKRSRRIVEKTRNNCFKTTVYNKLGRRLSQKKMTKSTTFDNLSIAGIWGARLIRLIGLI